MLVAAILKRKGDAVIKVEAEQSVASAARLLAERRIGAVLVVAADGAIRGILSERDVVRGVVEGGREALDSPVASLMTAEVVTCAPTDTVADIMRLMTERRIRHVPVLEDGRLAGLISIGDVVKERIEEAETEVEALRGYVAGAA